MGIYSANRTGRLGVQPANLKENYTSADANRIMYECVVNDNKIFEAILANDFREIKSMREGTLLESERVALNEASIKNLIASLKKHLSNFLGKIKSMVSTVITKISAYILRDGKAFVKNFREFMAKHANADPVTVNGKFKFKLEDELKADTSYVESIINTYKNESEKINKAEIVNNVLGKIAKTSSCSPKDFKTIMMIKNFKDKSISSSEKSKITNLCKILENASEMVSKLKKAEKDATKSINQIANELKNVEKAANSDNSGNMVKNITTLVSAGEQIISVVTSTQIAIIKAHVSSSRKALGMIMSKIRKDSNTDDDSVTEAAMDAEAEVEDAFDEIPGEDPSVDLDPEVASEIDDTVAAVEGKCC